MLTSVRTYTDPILDGIHAIIGGNTKTTEVEPGIYQCPHFNFGNSIVSPAEHYFDFDDMAAYGVADNIEQVKEKYKKWLYDMDKTFCISYTTITKVAQSPIGGWRWHKWGDYIGNKTPQCEYLYDENDIQDVICYHIYYIKP